MDRPRDGVSFPEAALEHATEMVYAVAKSGAIIYANRAARAALGWPDQARPRRHVWDFDSACTKSDWPRMWSQVEAAELTTLKSRHRCEDGTAYEVSIRLQHLRLNASSAEDDSECVCAYARRLQKREIPPTPEQGIERDYESLFATIRDGITWTDLSGRFVKVNQSVVDLTGYSQDELKHLSFRELTPERWREEDERILREQVLVDGHSEVFTRQCIRKDGTLVPVSLRVWLSRDQHGRPDGMWAIVRDISELEAMTLALKRSEAHWRSLTESSPDHITLLDRDGTILFVNHTVPDLTVAEVLGTCVLNYVPPQFHERIQASIDRVFETGQIDEYEVEYHTRTGDVRVFHSRIGPIRNGGEITAVVAHATDVTELRQRIRDVHERNLLLGKSFDVYERERKLLACEVHDGLVQYAAGALMQVECGQADLAAPLLRKAIDEARRLISGLRPPVLDELGIIRAIEYLAHEHSGKTRQVEFINETGLKRLPPALESAVFRIVQEGLNNVSQHSEATHAMVRLTQSGDSLGIELLDDGKGFVLENVAEKSFGLTGMRERTKLLGGTISIHSAPGAGTQVLASLPITL